MMKQHHRGHIEPGTARTEGSYLAPSASRDSYLAPSASASGHAYVTPGATPAEYTFVAPGAAAAVALSFPGAVEPLSLDDHVVEPESGQELIQGKVVQAMPGLPPHSDRQCELAYVIRANTAPDYIASSELLTRTSASWDFTTDACVRKAGIDPGTGERYLEEISFEIKHTQSQSALTDRARELVARGVRRVFAIHVEAVKRGGKDIVRTGPVTEWRDGAWVELDIDDVIMDRCFREPISVRALLYETDADNAVARALWDRKAPALVELMEKRESLGYRKALREAIIDLCEVLDIELDRERRAWIDSMDDGGLHRLRAVLKANRSWPERAMAADSDIR